MTQGDWDLGGLTAAETGRLLGDLAPRQTWLVPYRIELETIDGTEVLRPILPMVGPGALPGWPGASQAPAMLDAFVHLATASTDAILTYARRFGLLGLGLDGGLLGLTRRDFMEPEPVAAWRVLAGRTRAILNVAARLRLNESGRVEDWQAMLLGPTVLLGNPSQAEWDAAVQARYSATNVLTRAHEQMMLGQILEWLLVLAEAHPRPTWHTIESRLQLTYVGNGLLGALMIQTALACARQNGLAICSSCGEAYVPTRRPVERTRRYCSGCRTRGAPQRDASAAYRDRRRQPLTSADAALR